jgi:predicted ATPase
MPETFLRRGSATNPRTSGAIVALENVTAGAKVPDEVNVVIEIPKDAEPVKYEVDKATGAIFVDRVLSTPMRYPCNYGYVPQTLAATAIRSTCWSCCRCRSCPAR